MNKLLRRLFWGIGLARSFVVDNEDDGAGIVHNDTGEAEGTLNDQRLARMSQIADQSESDREEELAFVNDDDTTEPFRAKVPDAEVPAADSEVSEDTPQEEAAPTAPTKFKIRVNGRDLELTQEELIARASKVESADEYLRQAKQTSQPPKVAGPTPEELQRQRDEEDRALARALQMGTEEEAAATIRKIRESSSARPSLSQDDVSRVIDERLAFNTAVTKFRTEYSDIANDPYLNKLALDRDAELLAQGDTRSYWERYKEIGEDLNKWKSGLLASVQAPAAADNASRVDRKAAAPKVPTAASAKTKPPAQDDDTEESPHDVIQAMAKSRGGPQWMRT